MEPEIKITPAMLEAGTAALAAYDRRFDSLEEAVRRVYEAMETHRSRSGASPS